jgi:hypothetical protein
MANMNPNVSDMESIQAQLEKQKVGVCACVCVRVCVCVCACMCVCTCRDKLHKLTTVDVLRTSFDLSATVCIMSLLFHSPPPLPHPGDPTASNLQGGYPGEGPGPGLQAAPGGWGLLRQFFCHAQGASVMHKTVCVCVYVCVYVCVCFHMCVCMCFHIHVCVCCWGSIRAPPLPLLYHTILCLVVTYCHIQCIFYTQNNCI